MIRKQITKKLKGGASSGGRKALRAPGYAGAPSFFILGVDMRKRNKKKGAAVRSKIARVETKKKLMAIVAELRSKIVLTELGISLMKAMADAMGEAANGKKS